MVINAKICQSQKSDKKYDVYFDDDNKTVSFGGRGYSDYTMHKDDSRKALYLKRHAKNENWEDFRTPGFLSRYFLWNKKTLSGSIADVNKMYKGIVNFKYKKKC